MVDSWNQGRQRGHRVQSFFHAYRNGQTRTVCLRKHLANPASRHGHAKKKQYTTTIIHSQICIAAGDGKTKRKKKKKKPTSHPNSILPLDAMTSIMRVMPCKARIWMCDTAGCLHLYTKGQELQCPGDEPRKVQSIWSGSRSLAWASEVLA